VCLFLRSIASRLLVLALAIGLSAGGAVADDLSDAERAELQAKKDTLFQQMLRDPGNLDVSFDYADVSARLGNNEAAVSALERMLLFNPNLPRVDLELGALYFRMGSFEIARSYFEKAAAANPPPEVKARVDQYTAQIAQEESPQRFTGYLFFGAQYQSDANVAPGSPLVHSPVGDVLLSQQFVKQHDFNIFATSSVLYSYDLGTQDRDVFEVGGTAFVNHYFKFGRLDLDLGEVNAGPRLRFPDLGLPLVQSASLRPYAILNEVGLGENQYFFTYGSGIEGSALIAGDILARAIFEFRQKKFSNAPDRPLSTGLDGNDKLITLVMTKPITPNSALGAEFDYLDQSTKFAFYGNKAYSVAGSYRVRYADPTGTLPFPWETTLFASRSWAHYGAPDPCCNTSGSTVFFSPSARNDRRWRVGVSQSFQITDSIAIVAQLQRDVVSSNLPVYAYTSNSALVGAQIRF